MANRFVIFVSAAHGSLHFYALCLAHKMDRFNNHKGRDAHHIDTYFWEGDYDL